MLLSEPLQFATPVEGVTAFNLTRGDADGNPYSEVNLCNYTGDSTIHVVTGRAALCEHLRIPIDHLVMPRQTHGNRVAVIDSQFMQLNFDERNERLQGIDALITPLTGVCIGVNTADCVPIVIADPATGLIAVAHAGWKGTVARIATQVVQRMVQMGANPANMQAAIGVSICKRCFEVGDEVVQQFEQSGFDIGRIMHRYKATGKAHINLQLANKLTLHEAGIPLSHITIAHRCSRCNPHRYFSARRLGINSGRTFTAIIRH